MFKKWFCNHEYVLLGYMRQKNYERGTLSFIEEQKYAIAYCPRCDKEVRGLTGEIDLLLLKQEERKKYEGGYKQ